MNDTQKTATFKQEARAFEILLQRYLEDRDFLIKRADRQLFYFVDAHDLSSFIDPDQLTKSNEGFALHAEDVSSAGSGLELKLKNDRIMEDLTLDDDPAQVGLTPSHEDEFEDRLDYHFRRETTKQLDLFRQATDQVRAVMNDPAKRNLIRRFEVKDKAAEMTEAERNGVVEFFRQAAPAVLAVLWSRPDDTWARINRLMTTSALRYCSEIDWTKCGYDAAAAVRLRDFAPDPEVVDRWRGYLNSVRIRGSYRANRIDAEAIARIQGLNELLKAEDLKAGHPERRTRALLVTRAWALSAMCADREALRLYDLAPAKSLRHPRLAHLKNSLAAMRSSAEVGRDAERELSIALKTYRQQLDVLSDEEPADGPTLSAVVEPLVRALHDFEKAKFALDAHGRKTVDTSSDDRIRTVLTLFQSDKTIEAALRERLQDTVTNFSMATANMLRDRRREAKARVCRAHGIHNHHLLAPLTGPLCFPLAVPDAVSADRLDAAVDMAAYLREMSSSIVGSQGWTYVGWAALLSAEGTPRGGGVFAKTALEFAGPLGYDGKQLHREALFIRQQIKRLTMAETRPGHSPEDEKQQFHERHKRAGRWVDESEESWPPGAGPLTDRWLLERAALRLECRLMFPSTEKATDWPAFARDIAAAQERCRDDVTQLYILSVGIVGLLMLNGATVVGPDDQAAHWHDRLCRLMRELAMPQNGSREELPLIARAMELVGYQVQGRSGVTARQERLGIPAELRLEVGVLQEYRRATQDGDRRQRLDAITYRALKAIDAISDLLQHHLQRDLTFAPIWPADRIAEFLARIAVAEVRQLADEASARLQRITGPGQKYGVFHRDREDLIKVRGLLSLALERVEVLTDGPHALRDARYYLDMEQCFVDMLLTQLMSKKDRAAPWRALVQRYREIALAYPEAAIPHFRLNVIHEQLGEPQAQSFHLGRALALIDREPLHVDPSHWIRSTLLRRQCIERFDAAVLDRVEARQHPDLVGPYVDKLAEVVAPLLENFDPETEPSNELDALERHRRLNNVVFYLSHIVEVRPAGDERFTLAQFDHLRARLAPGGIERVFQPSVVHTIGFAHEVRRERDKCKAAGQHLKQLLLTSETEDVETSGKLLQDAEAWLREVNWLTFPRLEQTGSTLLV